MSCVSMRLFALLVLTLIISKQVNAEVLDIRGLGATYWTETNTVELRVEFNRTPVFPDDYFGLGLIVEKPHPEFEWVALEDKLGGNSMLTATHYHQTPQGLEENIAGSFPYSVVGNTWSATIPYSPLGLSEIPNTVNIIVGESRPFGQTEGYEGNPLRINELRMGYPVPEPSAVVLAGYAAMAIICSRRWLRMKR